MRSHQFSTRASVFVTLSLSWLLMGTKGCVPEQEPNNTASAALTAANVIEYEGEAFGGYGGLEYIDPNVSSLSNDYWIVTTAIPNIYLAYNVLVPEGEGLWLDEFEMIGSTPVTRHSSNVSCPNETSCNSYLNCTWIPGQSGAPGSCLFGPEGTLVAYSPFILGNLRSLSPAPSTWDPLDVAETYGLRFRASNYGSTPVEFYAFQFSAITCSPPPAPQYCTSP